MTEPVDTFEHAGLGVRICWQEWTEGSNPREHDGNIGMMFCDHPRYNLGDDDAEDPREVDLGIIEYLKREHDATVVLPLFLYDHSGITISYGANLLTGEDDFRRSGRFVSDGAGWDTSSVGVIYDTADTREQLSEENRTPEKVEAILRQEVNLYAAYLEGSVFGYEIVELDEDGEVPTDNHVDVLDSCWGYLEEDVHGEDAYVRHAAKEAAEHERSVIDKEKTEAAYWSARDVVTI